MNNQTLRETLTTVHDAAVCKAAEEERYYSALDDETDRGAAILAAEYFEVRLGKAIEQKLSTRDNKLRKKFKEKGLGLTTRIDIAFMLGLSGREIWKGLHDIV